MSELLETSSAAGFASASREIWGQAQASYRRKVVQDLARERRAGLDELVAALELRNLEGERQIDRRLRGQVRGVEAELGVPAPRSVLRARNTARLHSALLDWMETAMNQLSREWRRPSEGPAQ